MAISNKSVQNYKKILKRHDGHNSGNRDVCVHYEKIVCFFQTLIEIDKRARIVKKH